MKRISFVTLILAAIALFSSSCGTSDYQQSLLLTTTGNSAGGFYNLAGVDGTLQLQVLAVYHSGKMVDVTNNSTFTMVPVGTIYSPSSMSGQPLPAPGPTSVTINPNGLMTGLAAICTWEDLESGSPPAPDNPASWAYTGYYQTTATYRTFTSQPVGVGMGIAESNAPSGGCGPS